ncbi:MAG: site-specific DNA-methyltransferase [Gemmatimonadota bacterium]|nr:site-specific DNA-methyltransferase [Gemmatimonadota bacterium]
MTKKTKLELTWIGKDERPRLEPRILLEDPELSYHAPQRISENDIFDNRLIFGDNLLALRALEQEFAGKVKCVYIDPPYNSGSAFQQYDDGIEHSLWLSLMRERLECLARLLAPDGTIWASIDDTEGPYLRVLMDEVLGRSKFVATVIWEKRTSRENRRTFSFNHDYVLVYARDRDRFDESRNLLPLTQEVLDRYKNPDNDPRGAWQSVSATAQAGHATARQFYTLRTPGGAEFDPPDGSCWRYTQDRMDRAIADGRIWFGREQRNMPRIKMFLSEQEDAGLTPFTIWKADEVGTNDSAKRHLLDLFDGTLVFDTPKPEGLIERILHIATNVGDLVLDSFLGSGTTAAVAHKMGRRWIGVELGSHCVTASAPRLRKVVDGNDRGGVTELTSWAGGGGFRFFRLAPSLLERDTYGNWVVSKQYNPAMLAEAMCKHEGFTYTPSDASYWQHGRSTETAFLYVTTQTLGREQLAQLSEEVGPNRTLLVCCAAFRANADEFPNLTLKKIPHTVLNRCEWGRDDYSLAIAQLPNRPAAEAEEGAAVAPRAASAPARRGRRTAPRVPELFEETES